MKPNKSKNKIYVEKIIHKFYIIVKEDVDTGEVENTDFDFADDSDNEQYYFRAESIEGQENIFDFSDNHTKIDIGKVYKYIEAVMKEHGSSYERIILKTDGYYPRIVGIRLETDEEFADRMNKIKSAAEKNKDKKKLYTKKKLEERKKLYKKLKKEFEG